ncbi:MAG TPA: hypothetical protein VLG46_14440 [Anaerolineae bacterium]|nr:hypothetical protein [Anaerolineae bacterium]
MENTVDDSCCSVPEAGCETCELPSAAPRRSQHVVAACPTCHQIGKPVEGQTVKALLSVTLRDVQNTEYLFCKTGSCPVVYFSADGMQTFLRDQVRERVYQKESGADDVLVCYCFQHTAGGVRNASVAEGRSILDDINSGIQADQCACDLRNPQGSCCLGNVRALIKASSDLQRTTG